MAVIAINLLGLINVVAFQGMRKLSAAPPAVTTDSLRPKTVQRAITAVAKTAGNAHGLFVIANVNGQTVCRTPTADEASSLFKRDQKTTLHVITPLEKASASFNPAANGGGLNIILRGTDQLDQNPGAKQGFIRAASHWEA